MKKFDREILLDCATELLSYIGLQDPAYADRIQITREERGFDDLQIIGQYVSHVLDVGEHLCFAEREFMAPGYCGHRGPRECQVCGVEFTPATAADTVCDGQACREEYVAALDAKFEGTASAK